MPTFSNMGTGLKPPRKYTSQYARIDTTGYAIATNRLTQAAREELQSLLEQVAYQSAEDMKNTIATSGTAFSNEARIAGLNSGDGRRRTGRMYKDVTWRVEAGPKKIYATFGWIKNFQKYYSYQETGFRNFFTWARPLDENKPVGRKNGAWKWTPGMFALWNARAKAKDLVKKLTDNAAARIVSKAKG